MNHFSNNNDNKLHELKTINPYFSLVWDGKKLFDWRKFDRDFNPGDILVLKEYNIIELPNKEKQGVYLDRKIHCDIVFIMANPQRVIENNSSDRKDWIGEKTIDYDYCLMAINNVIRFVKGNEVWREIE